jgi:hypothetical protein
MRLYLLFALVLLACNSNHKPSDSSEAGDSEILKMIADDTFAVDTTKNLPVKNLTEMEMNGLSKIALKPLRPTYNLKELNKELVLEVYTNLLKTIERYQDSDQVKQDYLNLIFVELEGYKGKLEIETDYPIELKLKVASVVSDIHFMRSKQGINPKQD